MMPNTTSSAPKTIEAARAIMAAVDELPTVPAVVLRIAGKLDDPDVSIDDITDLLLQDQVLTTRVLRLVNSSFYCPLKHLDDLREAIIYLGLDHLKEVVFTCAVVDLFKTGKEGFSRSLLWIHALGVARVSKFIAERVGFTTSFTAYVAGLLHDVGAVFLNFYRRKDFMAAATWAETEEISLHEAEIGLLGTSHCEIGFLLGTRWELDNAIRDSLLYHHDLESAPREYAAVVALVSLADLFCTMAGLGYEEGNGNRQRMVDLEGHPAWAVLSQSFPGRVESGQILAELKGEIGKIRGAIEEFFPR